jgi:hypothetical protein
MGETSSASRLPVSAWAGGALLGLAPMPRPTRYRLRMRHAAAARASDALADHALPVLLVLILLLLVMGVRPGLDGALRLFWVGSGFGLLTGVPYVVERRGLRRRLASLPPVHDPLDDLRAALPEEPAAGLLARGDAAGAVAALEGRDRDDPVALRVGAMAAALSGDVTGARARALRAVQIEPPVWEVPAATGLALCRAGRFGEGARLLERAVDVSGGHHRAELMLAHGMALAGRLRDAVEALDRLQGRPPRRAPQRS